MDGYELLPDPGDDWSPTKRQVRRQREFEDIRVHATRMAAEAVGGRENLNGDGQRTERWRLRKLRGGGHQICFSD